jgi:hypothetical protein
MINKRRTKLYQGRKKETGKNKRKKQTNKARNKNTETNKERKTLMKK